MAEVLNTTERSSLGKHETRRLRRSGLVPAELYGHGEANVHLSVPRAELQAALRHGAHLVELQGAVKESALIRAVQWDPFGMDVLHIDLTRVSAEEAVEVTITVELRGTAAGAKDGGVVQHVLHEVRITCPAGKIPDKLEARISQLNVGDHFLASQLELPAGASLLTSPDQIVAVCSAPSDQAEAEGVPAEVSEPELIGRKAKDEEEEGGD
ncbi:MAG: 50S ribosomal protein L25 [Pirellulaceae bacterium]